MQTGSLEDSIASRKFPCQLKLTLEHDVDILCRITLSIDCLPPRKLHLLHEISESIDGFSGLLHEAWDVLQELNSLIDFL